MVPLGLGDKLLESHPSRRAPLALDSGILKELSWNSQQLGKIKSGACLIALPHLEAVGW